MGGDIVFGDVEAPLPINKDGHRHGGSDRACRPCRGVPSGDLHPRLRIHELQSWRLCHDQHAPMLREMARQMAALGVRPEIEAFDTGHLWFAQQLAAERLIEDPVLISFAWASVGRADDLNTFMAIVNNVPADGRSRPFPSAATPSPTRLRPCSPAAMSAWGLRTTSISAKASSRQSSARGKSHGRRDEAWAHGSWARGKSAKAQAGEALKEAMMSSMSAPTKPSPPFQALPALAAASSAESWIARFLLAGVDVNVFDPHPGRRVVREVIANPGDAPWPADQCASFARGRLTFGQASRTP